MSDDQESRFKFEVKPEEEDQINSNVRVINDKNKLNNSFGPNHQLGTINYIGQRSSYVSDLDNSRLNNSEISEIEKQKDRQIKKLTNMNKYLLQQLKQQNQQLTEKVNKQRFKFPKKTVANKHKKSQENGKQLEALKKQLQNVYRQIEFYKDNISILKAKQIPVDDRDKINQAASKLKQQNQLIQKLQNQIKTQKIIKQNQDKELGKINSPEIIQLMKKMDVDIKLSKDKIKQAKKNLTKRQQLEKKQHIYFLQLQALVKRTRNQQEKQYQEQKRMNQVQVPIVLEQQCTEQQWQQIKQKLVEQKRKYQEYGKKYNYLIFLKSKQSKVSQQLELKYKQKLKTLQKLKSKLHQVNKLARLKPKPQIMQRVDIKMQKLKDIISRQNSIEVKNISRQRSRIQSQDVRKFKKWQIQHASRDNNDSDEQLKYKKKNNNQIHYQNQNQTSDYRVSNMNSNSQLEVL